MLRFISVTLALIALTVQAPPVEAQEQPTPTHVVVRYFKCNPQSAAIDWLQFWRPAVEEMVEEGSFLDYRILSHNWGDEWNVVDEIAVSGLGDFFSNFQEAVGRSTALEDESTEDDEFPPFEEVCTEHKDNIYRIRN